MLLSYYTYKMCVVFTFHKNIDYSFIFYYEL